MRSENPDDTNSTLPLDQRTVPHSTNGVTDRIPALHKLWANLHYEWVPYRPPPKGHHLSIAGASETWCERASMILDDLDYLLDLPHHKVNKSKQASLNLNALREFLEFSPTIDNLLYETFI